VFDKAERVGGGLVSQGSSAGASSASSLVKSEPPAPGGATRVEVSEAVELLKAYSKAAERRDYDTAYSTLSEARQETFPRAAFERFWNGIARTGFFPDEQPSIEKALWRDDGGAVITVTLFFDVCKTQTRSVEHVTVVVERQGGELRLGDYSSKQDARLTGDPVPQDVLVNSCPS
jgi:hypothetical protein